MSLDPTQLLGRIEENGYDYVKDIDSNLDCPICRVPFVDPVMSDTCYHIFCRRCLMQAYQISPHCPIDRTPLQSENILAAPRVIRQMCDELSVKCIHHELGCTYTCQRHYLPLHLQECPFTETGCCLDECGETMPKKDLHRHMENCKYRLVECSTCKESVRYIDLESHNQTCPLSSVNCPHCSEKFTFIDLKTHETGCSHQSISCPNAFVGCKETGLRRDIDSEHVPKCPFNIVKDIFPIIERRMDKFDKENRRLRLRLEMSEKRETAVLNELQNLRRSLGNYYCSEPSLSESGPHSAVAMENQPHVDHNQDDFSTSEARAPPLSPPTSRPESPTAPSNNAAISELIDQSSSVNENSSSDLTRNTSQSWAQNTEPQTSPSSPHQNNPLFPQNDQSASSSWPSPSTVEQHNQILNPPLPLTIDTMKSHISVLAQNLEAIHKRDMNSINEQMHLQEEMQSLRAAVHFIRLQHHNILMDRREFLYASRATDPSGMPSSSSTSDEWGNKNGKDTSSSLNGAGSFDSGLLSSRYAVPSRYGPPPPHLGFLPNRYAYAPYGRRYPNPDTKL